MRTVETIKEILLETINGFSTDSAFKEIRHDLRECYSRDGLLTVLKKHMPQLVECGAVNGKMLEESFPSNKLSAANIHIAAESIPILYTNGEHFFFGKAGAELNGMNVKGHFFEQSYGEINRSQAGFYGESSGCAKDGSDIHVGGKAEVELTDSKARVTESGSVKAYGESEVNLHDQAKGWGLDKSTVSAYDHSFAIVVGKAVGWIHDQARFSADGETTILAYEKSRGQVDGNCICHLNHQSMAIKEIYMGSFEGKIIRNSDDAQIKESASIQETQDLMYPENKKTTSIKR